MSGAHVRQNSALIGLAFLIAAPLPGAAQQPPPRVRAQAKPVAVTTMATTTSAPLRPEQLPAVQPEVTYTNNQLTISAPNSTLGDILRAVRKQTGASVDVPPNATERVVGRFGPGSARDVLTSLLNGSHFNYMILGSASNPAVLDRLVLTQRTGGDANATQANNVPPNQQPAPPPQEGFLDTSEDAPEQQQQDIFAAEDPNNPNQPAQDDQNANQPFGQPQNNVKTPDQMLQELQQRQQQMQQQQQQQLGNPTMPFPRGGLPNAPPPQPQPNN